MPGVYSEYRYAAVRHLFGSAQKCSIASYAKCYCRIEVIGTVDNFIDFGLYVGASGKILIECLIDSHPRIVVRKHLKQAPEVTEIAVLIFVSVNCNPHKPNNYWKSAGNSE